MFQPHSLSILQCLKRWYLVSSSRLQGGQSQLRSLFLNHCLVRRDWRISSKQKFRAKSLNFGTKFNFPIVFRKVAIGCGVMHYYQPRLPFNTVLEIRNRIKIALILLIWIGRILIREWVFKFFVGVIKSLILLFPSICSYMLVYLIN